MDGLNRGMRRVVALLHLVNELRPFPASSKFLLEPLLALFRGPLGQVLGAWPRGRIGTHAVVEDARPKLVLMSLPLVIEPRLQESRSACPGVETRKTAVEVGMTHDAPAVEISMRSAAPEPVADRSKLGGLKDTAAYHVDDSSDLLLHRDTVRMRLHESTAEAER